MAFLGEHHVTKDQQRPAIAQYFKGEADGAIRSGPFQQAIQFPEMRRRRDHIGKRVTDGI